MKHFAFAALALATSMPAAALAQSYETGDLVLYPCVVEQGATSCVGRFLSSDITTGMVDIYNERPGAMTSYAARAIRRYDWQIGDEVTCSTGSGFIVDMTVVNVTISNNAGTLYSPLIESCYEYIPY